MSTGERVRILDYLPPEEKHKVLTLVQRLKEETEQKQKYMALYQQSQQLLQAITLKCNQLKDQNLLLKQQIHNSFSIVSQVRANFKANRRKLSQQKQKQDAEWEDLPDSQNEENHLNTVNVHSLTTACPPNPHKPSLQKYRPPMTTSKKQPPALNLSSNQLNRTSLNSCRSKELSDLKKQIQEMQKSKRKQEQKKKETSQKMRLVDQIKNRYKSGEESGLKSTDLKESVIERIDITHAFDYEEPARSKQKSSRVQSAQKPPAKRQRVQSAQKPPAKRQRVQSAQKPPAKRQRVQSAQKPPAKRQREKSEQGKYQAQPVVKYTSPSKGHVITSEDYDDVLDLINN